MNNTIKPIINIINYLIEDGSVWELPDDKTSDLMKDLNIPSHTSWLKIHSYISGIIDDNRELFLLYGISVYYDGYHAIAQYQGKNIVLTGI